MAAATTPIPKDALYTNGTNGISDTPHVMTWDEYLSEPTVYRRYDIVEGVRIFTSAPLVGHQEISANVNDLLRTYQKRTATGRTLYAPCDVLVRRVPHIQVRQPDLLFVTNDRLARQPDYRTAGYLSVTPNLVVEILSDSDRRSVVAAKLADYFTIGVDEIWIIRPEERTVDVLVRSVADYQTDATYTETDALISAILPGLSAPVAGIFS
ncbi:MAG: Uma2 family endonuclease [Armatimonadetes bacterium]|nr:Uma2 family endonuclease [Armatimonadota bacterium]